MVDLARLLQAARPASLVAGAYERLFRKVPGTEAWAAAVREAAGRGALVHVLRNISLIDLLALDYMTRRYSLPPIGFSNELSAWIEPPMTASREPPEERLRRTLKEGKSAVLFMKKPPDMLAGKTATRRGRSEGDELLRSLLDAQQREELNVILVPQTLVWTKRPDRHGFSVVDTLFGPAEFPGDLRAAAQFVLNFTHGVVRAGEALHARDFLDDPDELHSTPNPRRLSYALLRRLERERRAVLGPAQKPADRVREEVLRSPKLKAAMEGIAQHGDKDLAALADEARAILEAMQAAPDPPTLRGLEVVADALVDRVYSGIDVDEEGMERLRDAAKRGSLVLLPSHKSHVDYVLMSFVLRRHGLQLPVVAAGDNLAFFPVGPIFRRAGAFFIRRSFRGDRLYPAVVDAYMRRLLRDGWVIEFFLEGGRSRTGKLLPPKLGLLNMIVDAALALEGRRVSFVPVSIGYERMMEEGSYARELSGEAKKAESASELLKVTSALREKYGRANVQIGAVIDLGDESARAGITPGEPVPPVKRRAVVTKLAHKVMSEINRVTAVTPGSLVATALLSHRRRGLPHADLVEQCARLYVLARSLGARTTPSLDGGSRGMREQAIREAIAVYVRGGLVRQHVPGDTLTGKARKRSALYAGSDVIYLVPDDKRILLDFSKNSILHLVVDRALISVALLSAPASAEAPAGSGAEGSAKGAPLGLLRDRVQALSKLFKFEFMFRADAPFQQIFEETVGAMAASGELAVRGEAAGFGPGHDGLDGRGWIAFYASVVRSFVEGYRIAARTARVLTRGPLAEKELTARALRVGEQMFLGGEIERSEAVSRPVFENAFAAFLEQGALKRDGDKIALAAPFASEESAQAIEAGVASFLFRRAEDGRW
jgi:glycerol-3-phosphate O-acyltransferase